CRSRVRGQFTALSFLFNAAATPAIYTLSLHDALPIYGRGALPVVVVWLLVSMLVGCGDAPVDERVAGRWHGAIEVPGAPVVVGVEFTGRHSGVIDIPAQQMTRHPLERSEEHTSELQSRENLV